VAIRRGRPAGCRRKCGQAEDAGPGRRCRAAARSRSARPGIAAENPACPAVAARHGRGARHRNTPVSGVTYAVADVDWKIELAAIPVTEAGLCQGIYVKKAGFHALRPPGSPPNTPTWPAPRPASRACPGRCPALLVSEACNVGLTLVADETHPPVFRARLNWVAHNYLLSATPAAANARLAGYHTPLPLAQAWGGGEIASAGGMRFVIPVATIHAACNPRLMSQARGAGIVRWRHDHRRSSGPGRRRPVTVGKSAANPACPATGPGPFLLQSRV
jgi:hypothetical protein